MSLCRPHNTCSSTRSLLGPPFTQNLVCKLAASASPGSLLEMQNLWPHPKSLESEPECQQDFQLSYIHTKHYCMCGAKSRQSCLILCDPMDCSPLGTSVHGILQQEYWSGLSYFLTQGSNPRLLRLLQWQEGSLPLAPPGKIHCRMEFPKYLVWLETIMQTQQLLLGQTAVTSFCITWNINIFSQFSWAGLSEEKKHISSLWHPVL